MPLFWPSRSSTIATGRSRLVGAVGAAVSNNMYHARTADEFVRRTSAPAAAFGKRVEGGGVRRPVRGQFESTATTAVGTADQRQCANSIGSKARCHEREMEHAFGARRSLLRRDQVRTKMLLVLRLLPAPAVGLSQRSSKNRSSFSALRFAGRGETVLSASSLHRRREIIRARGADCAFPSRNSVIGEVLSARQTLSLCFN